MYYCQFCRWFSLDIIALINVNYFHILFLFYKKKNLSSSRKLMSYEIKMLNKMRVNLYGCKMKEWRKHKTLRAFLKIVANFRKWGPDDYNHLKITLLSLSARDMHTKCQSASANNRFPAAQARDFAKLRLFTLTVSILRVTPRSCAWLSRTFRTIMHEISISPTNNCAV